MGITMRQIGFVVTVIRDVISVLMTGAAVISTGIVMTVTVIAGLCCQ